jgi:hypothetical protein
MCGTDAQDRTCIICEADEVVRVARRHGLHFSRCERCGTEFAFRTAA